ncbi:MAG: class I SAM-dependent methyltransferase [Eubacteriales bacterium]|nr:class I SAM-dependent methyltransferase [Eubacteriales bacterium]
MREEKFNEQTERYRRNFEKYGYSEQSMFMPSDRRTLRYYELLKNFDFFADPKGAGHFSLCDAGCGFGDINGYLQRLGVEDYSYTGLDVVDEFMKEGESRYGSDRIRYLHRNFITDDISDLEFDYAVSSQTFTIAYSDEDSNYDVVYASVRKLFEQCKKGVSFNFFTDQGQFKRVGTAYHNPAKLAEFAYSLSNAVILDNGCFPYECTLTILKDRACTANGMVFDRFMEAHRKQFEDGTFVVLEK